MPPTIESLGIDKLSVEDRLQLVSAIWDSIAEDSPTLLITESQKTELDRRLEDKKKNPDDFAPWEQVRAEALGRIRQ